MESPPRPPPSTLAAFFDAAAVSTNPDEDADAIASARHKLLGAALPPPRRVGRYLLGERIGSGGMGVVHVAHDPELRRDLAIKLVRGRIPGRRAHDRLLREGQTLARLNHPNIVTIFDVGTHGDQVFLAMELVDGDTLDLWLARTPRSTREIADVLLAAGRGLAAAHRAGIVHRDFKPNNILIDRDRTRVVDFGIACAATSDLDDGPGVTHEGGSLPGAGTPGYMAPEQRLGHDVDAAADQFAFCVTAWETLHGARPDDPRHNPRRIPSALRQALRRGLRPDPAARWPSMDDLLARIDAALAPRSRARRLTLALAATTGLALALLRPPAISPACRPAPQLADVWDPALRASVRDALRAPKHPFARETSDHTLAVLDQRAAAWMTLFTHTCSAAESAPPADLALLHARLRCLAEHRRELAATTSLLAHNGAELGPRALSVAQALTPATTCLGPTRTPNEAPRSDHGEQLRTRLAEAVARLRSGAPELSATMTEDLAHAAAALDDPRLHLEIDLHRGRVASYLRRDLEARAHLERAYFTARKHSHDDLAARAAIYMLPVVARHDPDAFAWWRQLTPIEAERSRHPEDLRDAAAALGEALHASGDYPAAEAAFIAAQQASRALHGPGASEEVSYFNYRGLTLERRGRHAEALALFQRARLLSERTLGRAHPIVGTTYDNIGGALQQLGHPDAALQAYRRGLEIREAVAVPDDHEVAGSLHNIATVELERDHIDEAIPLLRRALAIERRALGPTSRAVAITLSSLGAALDQRGDPSAGEPLLAQAIALHPEDHPDTAVFHLQHAAILRNLGRLPEARAAVTRALEILTALPEPDPALLTAAHATLDAIPLNLSPRTGPPAPPRSPPPRSPAAPAPPPPRRPASPRPSAAPTQTP